MQSCGTASQAYEAHFAMWIMSAYETQGYELYYYSIVHGKTIFDSCEDFITLVRIVIILLRNDCGFLTTETRIINNNANIMQ